MTVILTGSVLFGVFATTSSIVMTATFTITVVNTITFVRFRVRGWG